MANGLQIAASGLNAQQKLIDALADDVGNIGVQGYRPSRTAFVELLGGGVRAISAGHSMKVGEQSPSDNPLAVALDGPGYIQVSAPDGSPALTRAADMSMDAKRQLVLSGGNIVQPPIVIPDGVQPEDVEITSDGSVRAAGRTLGKLKIVDVPSPDGLAGIGGGVLVPTQASGAIVPVAPGTTVVQGMIEESPSDLLTSMTNLQEAQRAYELASRAIKTHDQLLELANGIRH